MSSPDTLAAWTLAAMVEAELITLEAESGHNFAGARRPLTRTERRATTRFADIDAHVTTATNRAKPLVRRLLQTGAQIVLTELFPQGAEAIAADAARQLTDLSVNLATAAADTLTTVVPDIRDTLTGAWRFGATTILEELSRQGVEIDGWMIPTAPATIEALAANIATHPLIRQLEIASRYVTDPFRTLGMQVSRAEIENLLAATSEAASVDLMHQGVQSVLSLGRLTTAESINADQFAVAFSSELLDRSTCPSCAAVDGTRYDTLAAARADYGTGGFRLCAGGPRCRGLIVLVTKKDGASSSSLATGG